VYSPVAETHFLSVNSGLLVSTPSLGNGRRYNVNANFLMALVERYIK
jgi:hypothetical protein